ncbi:hypothetical protein HJ187_17670 [Vibrio parahaemolyticus]|nr:hypothetical protein [Vibrio parahaemolyticus]
MPVSIYDSITDAVDEQTEEEKLNSYVALHKNTFVLCPAFMGRTEDVPELDWKTVDYDQGLFDLPQQQGVYAFSVEVKHPFLPSNSYLMYVGKAGDTDSDNTIKKRYRNYCTTSGLANRPKVRPLINRYSQYLKYHYAEVPDGVSTGEIEKMLTTIFLPPYNQADFERPIKNILKAIGVL